MSHMMLRSGNELVGNRLHAVDGDVGQVQDFYFDDQDWRVLYLVIDTGHWLPGRKALVAPFALADLDWVEGKFDLQGVTKEMIESSPAIELHKPITREQEVEYFGHFGWPCLWAGELRASAEVIDARVDAIGGAIGTMSDLLVDESWTVRYLVVRLPSRDEDKMWLCSPQWIEEVDWAAPVVHAALPAEKIRSAPAYDPSVPITRDFEVALYQHYELNPYWT
jgi:hypothetical protein